MIPFRKVPNAWLIEHRDVGSVHLLAGGVEHRLQRSDVGLLYIIDARGDRLEVAPQEDKDVETLHQA